MYPKYLLQLKLGTRKNESSYYGISNKSEMKEVDKTKVTKKPYSDELLLYIKNESLIAYGVGTNININFEYYKRSRWYPENRKQVIDECDRVFIITEDKEVETKRQKRNVINKYDDPVLKTIKTRIINLVNVYKTKYNERILSLIQKEKENILSNISNQIDEMFTKSYRHDLSSNSIKLSAEIKKLSEIFDTNSYGHYGYDNFENIQEKLLSTSKTLRSILCKGC